MDIQFNQINVFKMKYANGCMDVNGKQVNAFVCAKTFKRMLELLDMNPYYFNNYWSKIGNEKMMNIAQNKEGIWVQTKPFSDEYFKLR